MLVRAAVYRGAQSALAIEQIELDAPGSTELLESWSRLSEQNLRVDKWSVCRV